MSKINRIIKFRLLKNGKIVGWEKHDRKGDVNLALYHSEDNKNWKCILYPNTSGWITHDDKDQYTGLKDKKGVEMYENDRVKITVINNREIFAIGIIVFDSDTGKFVLQYEKGEETKSWMSITSTDVKVIGNVYDRCWSLPWRRNKGE